MRKRLISVSFVFLLAFFGIGTRIYYLSNQKPLATAANQQTKYTLTVSQTRANIYDCDMVKLVNKDTELTAAVLPTPENMMVISKNTDKKEISNDELMTLYSASRPFLTKLKTHINEENVSVFDTTVRYRENQLAAHIIGCVGSDENGRSGIERAYNGFLKQNEVIKTISYSVNGAGRKLSGVEPVIATSGNEKAGVVLTIDSDIQNVVESIGANTVKNGAIIVMDPYSGDIKAMASFPTFTQNNLAKSIEDTENTPMINRALSAFAVGSSFKISTAATAIESGVTEIWYKCTGQINVHGQKFKCHERGGHGFLTMKQAMAKSCNTYFIKLGLSLDRLKLRNMAADLSFGKSFELAKGVVSDVGTLPSIDDLNNSAEVANFSFGQGKLTATPLQISLMTSCIINGGKMPQPRLVAGTTTDGANIEETETKANLHVMSKQTADRIKSFLDFGVMETENQYALPISVSAGGKTATAQTGKYSNGTERLNTWFTGYFPADKPKYIVTVLCENGTFGNLSASPVFQKIADQITALEAENE